MNINEKTFFKFQNQNNLIKKDNKYYRKCRLCFIYLFIIILLVVDNYTLRLKSQNYIKLLTEEKEKKIFYNNNKDELLKMCYKSRTLYFTKNRRQTVESFGMKYDENNLMIN